MNLSEPFQQAKKQGRLGLIVYTIPGFPTAADSNEIIGWMQKEDAVSIIENTIPVTKGFSDHANATIRAAHTAANICTRMYSAVTAAAADEIGRAIELSRDGSLDVLRILSCAAATIAEGEVLQLSTQNDLTTPEDRYLDVIKGKTAALFAAACEVGAIVAHRPSAEQAALAEYGTALGMAFQLVDDALDYAADQAKLGKTVGDDFREGKVTLPVLVAYHAGDADERAFWERTIEHSDQTDADLDRALSLMSRHGAIAATIRRASAYAREAQTALRLFPDSAMRQALSDVADYTVSRVR